MTHVFISYKREDREFVTLLEQIISSHGLQVWTDAQIEAGEEWRIRIDEAIKNCFALTVLMTPSARASEYVTYEWSYALGMGKPVIPMIYKPTQQLHPKLSIYQALNLANNPKELDKLVPRLKKLLVAHEKEQQKKLEQEEKHPNPQNTKDLPPETTTALDVSQLLSDLQYMMSWSKREKAAKRLGALGSFAGMDVINVLTTRLLNETDHGIRSAIAEALGRIGYPIVVPALMQALVDERFSVQTSAVNALKSVGTPEALEAVARFENK